MWYLLYCKSQDVKKIIKNISLSGITYFYPRYVKITKRTDCNSVRIKDRPLFPNYLFLSFDVNKIHTSEITAIPGAIGFVRFGAGPCIIPDKVISVLKYTHLVSINKNKRCMKYYNISSDLYLKVQDLLLIESDEKRQVLFSKLLESEGKK